MEEKELIVSEKSKLGLILLLIVTILGLIIVIGCFGDAGFDYWGYGGFEGYLSWGGTLLLIVGIFLLFYFKGCELHVTNKRVYKKTSFGLHVDIPIDSITSIGQLAFFKGVIVASSSAKIKFFWLKNSKQIKDKITFLVLARSNTNIND